VTAAATEPLALCTFLLSDHVFALPMADAQEVLRDLPTTPVPLAGATVRGLANLRGQIATSLDLRALLGFPAAPAGAPHASVVVRTSEGLLCLTVDDIGDVIQVPATALERPPETLNPTVRDALRGICKLQDSLVLVLDTARVTDPAPPPREAASRSWAAPEARPAPGLPLPPGPEERA
jgi:purine-binding chemotaxis protein CheW